MNEFVYDTNQALKIPVTTGQQQYTTYQPYNLVDKNDPILTTKIPDFDFGNPSLDPIEIAERLISTAKLYDSYCIAANQVGLSYKLFVAGSGDNFVGFFNPEIISVSKQECVLPEMDLSNAGLVLYVKRPKSISLQYIDFNGETHLQQFDGITARIILQNVDRLNGVDFKSKVSNFSLDRKKKALNKKIKKIVRSQMLVKKV